ncbi:MAG: uroporphyrinogen decarboxylase family protein [Clostridia bacterium]|nr:uroporphyrinogen decarboxylase family protein [Clostridia bacterium]
MSTQYYIDEVQVKESHDRLKKAYRMEEVDHVPIVEMTAEPLGYTIFEIAYDEKKMLKQQLHNISLTMKHKTDYCPYLEPWHGVSVYAEPFGVDIEWPKNDWPWSKPIIFDNPMDVYKLKPKKVHQSFLWKKIFKTIEYFQRETNGDIPIATTDPQSPITTASFIWQTDQLFLAMYTNPKEVHYILNMITDLFIEFYDKQLQVIENPAFPGHSFPLGEPGRGISISDDNSVMLSPKMYEEYCLPYYKRIAEHFNGLYIHSCGNFTHNIPSMLKIPKLRAINYHSSYADVDPLKGRRLAKGKCAVWTGFTEPEIGFNGNRPPLPELFEDFYVPNNIDGDEKGIILTGFGSYTGTENISPEEQNDRYDWIVKLTKKFGC